MDGWTEGAPCGSSAYCLGEKMVRNKKCGEGGKGEEVGGLVWDQTLKNLGLIHEG